MGIPQLDGSMENPSFETDDKLGVTPIWSFPKMGTTPKSSILDWDSPL